MSGATTRADFVYFIKYASPALPDHEAYFMLYHLQLHILVKSPNKYVFDPSLDDVYLW